MCVCVCACMCVCVLNDSQGYIQVLFGWTNSDRSGGPLGPKNAKADFFVLALFNKT